MIINNKVTIIGAGNVGSTIAYTLLANSSVDEMILVDINKDKADAEALDLKQSSHFYLMLK